MSEREVLEARHRAIRAAAFERYLLDLIQLLNEEQERGWERRGKVLEPELFDFRLAGEYPETKLKMKARYQKRGEVLDGSYAIWGNSQFFDADDNYEQVADEVRIVTDIMTWARGG